MLYFGGGINKPYFIISYKELKLEIISIFSLTGRMPFIKLGKTWY